MFYSFFITCVLILSIFLSSCNAVLTGVQSYVDTKDGYQFLYPDGWIQVKMEQTSEGVDTVFHDLVARTENLSVIINPIENAKTVKDLGTPSEVGYRFLKEINSNSDVEREGELIRAGSYENQGKTYYNLEYQVKLPNNKSRHDIANVTINRGKLYTFNLSTPQNRWSTVKPLFERVVQSFQVF
ncbi:MAG: photosystem II reaction center PsbP [Microcystaceae cyanobacterium]